MTGKRVLIVEDEFIIAESIKEDLEGMGYSVTSVVSSGELALIKASEDKPDVIIMDITLKGEMDGIEAALEIKKSHVIPVIFLTAHSSEHFLEKAKAAEPFGYLPKPYQAKELRETIEMALCKRKMENN